MLMNRPAEAIESFRKVLELEPENRQAQASLALLYPGVGEPGKALEILRHLIQKEPKDYIGIRYHALEANAVMKPHSGKSIRVYVQHDGKPVAESDKGADIRYDDKGQSYLLVEDGRMYHIIKNAKFGQRRLRLATAEPGLGIYAFTFVSCEVSNHPQ